MKNDKLTKVVFYIALVLTIYFLFVFNGVLQDSNLKLVGALFELLTIPSILLIGAIFIFSIYQLVTRHVKLTFYNVANVLISGTIILLMFLVK